MIVGSLYAMDTLRLELGGAVQNGRLRNPGSRKSEGDGRHAPVLTRRDGPWIITAASGGGCGGRLEDCEENEVEI